MMLKTNPGHFHLYPLGDAAIVIQFAEEISEDINNKVRAICRYLEEYTFDGFVEYVPAFANVTVFYDPSVIKYPGLVQLLQEQIDRILDLSVDLPSTIIEIPVLYGGKWGPDLNIVAESNDLSVDEVISLHTSGSYLVYMIGFAPGFPYLGGMDERIATPRKETPRSKIAAGAVGIAGKQTGIYPIETPGGWQIIGQTPLELFELNREIPALLNAGDRVRFVSITEKDFKKIREDRNGN